VADEPDQGLLLGRNVPPVDRYAPELLHAIARAEGRDRLGLSGEPPFSGVDTWHAYELSWLDGEGVPQVAVGRFSVPAESPHMVESKSLKLYLNSLNNTRFDSADAFRCTLEVDLAAVVDAPVSVELLGVDAADLAGNPPPGDCLDGLAVPVPAGEPSAVMLAAGEGVDVEESLYTHLLRSLCPVTGQPDWATLWLRYRGPTLDRRALLSYLLAFRNHREYHEQCVERIFIDVLTSCRPVSLQVQGLYTRRGGLDINPYRSSAAGGEPLARLNRQ